MPGEGPGWGEGTLRQHWGQCHLLDAWLPAGDQSEGTTETWWSCPCAVSQSMSHPLVKELRLTELM